jgi:hypothetical protein
MRHVTKTGRTTGQGRVTRASSLVGRPKQKGQLPLPMELQCYPQAWVRTTRHPACNTRTHPHGGQAHSLNNAMRREDFQMGNLLHDKSHPLRYEIRDGEQCLGYTDDIVFAMAWTKAAKSHGVFCDVLDGE